MEPPVSPSARGAQEVETEFEDEEELATDVQGLPHEVEEDLEIGVLAAAQGSSADYAIPARNREVWRSFGCDTEAGKILRRLYTTRSASESASRVAYPRLESPSQRWEPKQLPRRPCPQRAAVRVPRPRSRQRLDPDDPRGWRAPAPGRRPAGEILAELEAQRPERPSLAEGRDLAAEKRGLQDRFQFCGGRALPRGAMGHVPSGELPRAPPRERPGEVDPSGMTAEQRGIFEDLLRSVREKQARLAELEAAEPGPQGGRARAARTKEALELKNDIQRCLKDIDTLLEITG